MVYLNKEHEFNTPWKKVSKSSVWMLCLHRDRE